MNIARNRKVLGVKAAEAVLDAGADAAAAKGYRVVIAVVDHTGELVALRRLNGAQVASSRVAVDKARTAAIFVRPSREIEEQVSSGRLGALALHGASALTGGIPLVVDGHVVGAVGTSGETPDEDESVSIAAASAAFSTVDVSEITHEGARLAAEAAGAVAKSRGVSPVVAVVDSGGELVYLWRPDRAQVASVGVATDKARTAAIYRRPSKDFEDQASGGRPSALHLARAVPLQGGIPLAADGHVIGAIGVSGATSADEDLELALIGAEAVATAFANGSSSASYFPSSEVDERFATGGLLLDTDEYKIDAGRRTAAGEVEFHEHVTDIMYVLEGCATVVTGGEMVDVRSARDGELRAGRIEGGDTNELHPGDVLAVPAGVPHQFTRVSDPFLYYVVKVAS